MFSSKLLWAFIISNNIFMPDTILWNIQLDLTKIFWLLESYVMLNSGEVCPWLATLYSNCISEPALRPLWCVNDTWSVMPYNVRGTSSALTCNCLLVMQPSPGSHFTKVLWAHDPYFDNNTCYIYVTNNGPIKLELCTCHDPWVVLTCTKLWPDWIIRMKIRASRLFTRFQLWTLISFV